MTETRVVLSTREKDYIALPVGTEVGRYTILAVLGQGGFGVTYHAHDRSLNREVAIKEYLPTSFAVRGDRFAVVPTSTRTAEDFAWGRQRFTEEGRMLASFQQAPGIVRVYDFLEANGTAYIVMELVNGITLGQRIDRGRPLSAEETERILLPLLDGLAQVHAAGIVHRDIKPDNILLDRQGRPTLIDFGAARAAMAGRTEAVTALYTPGYAAVEQFTDARQGPWTDIYGLSATLYHAISCNKAPTAVDRVIKDACEPLVKLRPAGFPRELLAGLDRGMAPRSEDRPQSIDAWKAMLVPSPQARPVNRRSWQIAPYIDAWKAMVAWRPQAQPANRRTWRIAAYGVLGALLLAGAAGGTWLLLAPAKPADEAAARQAADQEARRRALMAQQQREQAEAEARQRAATEEARRRADAEAAARARDEQEARQRAAAAEEARRRAEAEAAARAGAQDEARQRAEAEQARRRAEQEARDRAAAEAEARKRQQDAESKAANAETERLNKTAEAGEAALRLSTVDRQRLQIALTAQGFDTRGADGMFGPRSREMVAAWQKARGHAATGYVDAAQQQQLLNEAAAAIGKFDAEQKKAEEARLAEEAARRASGTSAAAPSARSAPPPRAAAGASSAGGSYAGSFSAPSELDGPGAAGHISLTIGNGAGSGTISLSGGLMPRSRPFSVAVAPDGSITGQGEVPNNRGPVLPITLRGQVEGTRIRIELMGLRAPLAVTLDKAG